MRGFYDLWPRIVGDALRAAPARRPLRRRRSTAWTRRSDGLCWLEPEERRLVWLRAEGLPWKWITHRLGIGRTTAWQRWTIGPAQDRDPAERGG